MDIDIYVDEGTNVRTHTQPAPVDSLNALIADQNAQILALATERDAAVAAGAALTVERAVEILGA